MTSPAVERFLETLREQRARGQEVAATPPAVERAPRQPLHNALHRGDPPPGVPVVQQRPPAPQLTLDAARERILREITDYATSDDERVLLLRVTPGAGKSYNAVKALQKMPEGGRRIYTASMKNFWKNDLTRFDIFEPEKWWNWLALQPGDEEKGEPMTCRVYEAMKGWLQRGYPGIELCRQLCFQDGWVGNCEYRKQAKRKEPLISARHNHLVFGLAFKDMDMAIADELPLNAFLWNRFIPDGEIVPSGTAGPVTELFQWLQYLAEAQQYHKGKDLLDIIGGCLGDVYAQVEVSPDSLPEIPVVSGPEDVAGLPYHYWSGLLLALAPEYECWREGWTDWVSRVKIKPGGVQILGRRPVWENLPKKVVMLDATGDKRIARAIFERPIKLVECSVKAKGRMFQVVGRMNGIGQMLDPDTRKIAQGGLDMLESAKLIRDAGGYKKVGVVTFKKMVKYFAPEFDDVLWFGAVRGTNVLIGCDAVILAGAPNWPLWAVADTAAMLFPKRMKSFSKDDEGEYTYPWRSAACEYRVRDGQRAWRFHRGFWDDAELRTVLESSRVAEVVQSAHRGRPILFPCDTWILTSIPTPLELDNIFQDLSESWLTPKRDRTAWTGPSWFAWLRLRPWLAEQWAAAQDDVWLTAVDLAAVGGVRVETVRRQRWLATIADFSDKWFLEPRQIGRGRPRLGILAVDV